MYRVLIVDDVPTVLSALQSVPRMTSSSNSDRDVVKSAANESALGNERRAPFG